MPLKPSSHFLKYRPHSSIKPQLSQNHFSIKTGKIAPLLREISSLKITPFSPGKTSLSPSPRMRRFCSSGPLDKRKNLNQVSKIRLYVRNARFQPQTQVSLDTDQTHYLMTVMRKKENDWIRVFNGGSGEWKAKILGQADGKAVIETIEPLRPPISSHTKRELMLCFAPLKKVPLSFLIQKATELGVDKFQPIISDLSTSDFKMKQIQTIIVDASEQCERLQIPILAQPIYLKKMLTSWNYMGVSLFLNEKQNSTGSMIDRLISSEALSSEKFSLFVGPEGGWSPKEIIQFEQLPEVVNISLGNNILRSETAAIAALSVLQNCLQSDSIL